MQRIHEHVTVHGRPPSQPEEKEVDHETDNVSESTPPERTEEGGPGDSNALAPPSRQERMRSIPIIAQSRWASLLARHPPGEIRGK
eukprot:1202057-Pyramimonas_sp.AAC.1